MFAVRAVLPVDLWERDLKGRVSNDVVVCKVLIRNGQDAGWLLQTGDGEGLFST